MDWTATVLDAAGVAPPSSHALDGVSLLPVLRGEPEFHRTMYWRMNHRGQRAMRDGRWKHLRVDGNDYLFDLDADERQRANRAHCEGPRLDAMRDSWLAWNATMPEIPGDATVSLGYSVKDMPQR